MPHEHPGLTRDSGCLKTGSVASSHSGTPSLGSARAMAVRYEAAEAAAAATAAQMAGLEKPPRPLGHSRTTSASESASSLGAPPPPTTS